MSKRCSRVRCCGASTACDALFSVASILASVLAYVLAQRLLKTLSRRVVRKAFAFNSEAHFGTEILGCATKTP